MYEVGSCILLRQTILPHLNYRNIPLDDTYLWDREFSAKYGLNINQWLLENNIKLEPHFILKIIKIPIYCYFWITLTMVRICN